jgi:hypothetical protein
MIKTKGGHGGLDTLAANVGVALRGHPLIDT